MANAIIRYEICTVDGVRCLVAVIRTSDGGERWQSVWMEGYDPR